MNGSDRIPSDEELRRLVDDAAPSATIPFEGAAFWSRLRAILGPRYPSCNTDAGCIEWLADKTRITRRTFKRWSQGKPPHWENVSEVRAALDKNKSAGTPDLADIDLVRDLPLREPTAPKGENGEVRQPDSPDSPQRVSVFVCCAAEDAELAGELETHVALLQTCGEIDLMRASDVPVGTDEEVEVIARIDGARLVIALVTAHLFSSAQCTAHLAHARSRGTPILPILAESCLWDASDLARDRPLPSNKKFVSAWPDRNDAWTDVVLGLRAAVRKLRAAAPRGGPSSAPDSQRARFARRLAEVEGMVAAALERMPRAVAALAARLGLEGAARNARDVAKKLLHGAPGKEIVKALNGADEAMKDSSSANERQALKRMMLQLVPFASDWRHYAVSGRAALAAGAKLVELPLGSLTVAETILAGIDCRECRFVADTKMGPIGGALVRKPAIDGFFLDPKGARLTEATVGLLGMHLFDMAPDDPALRDHASMRARVDEALEYYCEVEGTEHLPRWLLLDDEMLAYPADAPADVKGAVEAAVVVLGDELPHLRILRMGKLAPGEINYAMNIGGFWRKPL